MGKFVDEGIASNPHDFNGDQTQEIWSSACMAKERDTKLRQTALAVGCPALIMSRRIPTMINYIWKTLPGLVSGRRHLLTEHNGLTFRNFY